MLKKLLGYSYVSSWPAGRRTLAVAERPSARSNRGLTEISSLASTTLGVSLACKAFHDRFSFSRWVVLLARSPQATRAGRKLSGDVRADDIAPPCSCGFVHALPPLPPPPPPPKYLPAGMLTK